MSMYRAELMNDGRWHIIAPDGYQITTEGYGLEVAARDECLLLNRQPAGMHTGQPSAFTASERERLAAQEAPAA